MEKLIIQLSIQEVLHLVLKLKEVSSFKVILSQGRMKCSLTRVLSSLILELEMVVNLKLEL